MRKPRSVLPSPESAARSKLMARIRSKDTAPEKRVRRILFAMGYRFRIHKKDLPGCPDIAFIARKKVIFVNGCFWHQHPNCPRATLPATNRNYWLPKLAANIQRDKRVVRELAHRGWRTLTIWECETIQEATLRKRLRDFLGPTRATRQGLNPSCYDQCRGSSCGMTLARKYPSIWP